MEGNKESINELLKIAMNSIKEMTDVNIIVGEKIVCDGVTIIPISKVKSGFVSGGIDQMRKYEYDIKTPFGGGAGGTLTISPVAFLVINKEDVKVLHLEENPHILEKIIDFIPSTFDKVVKTFKKDK